MWFVFRLVAFSFALLLSHPALRFAEANWFFFFDQHHGMLLERIICYIESHKTRKLCKRWSGERKKNQENYKRNVNNRKESWFDVAAVHAAAIVVVVTVGHSILLSASALYMLHSFSVCLCMYGVWQWCVYFIFILCFILCVSFFCWAFLYGIANTKWPTNIISVLSCFPS